MTAVKYSSTTYDVIVLGAGAAGLFAAYTAAKRGRQVLVLEKSNKVGKKILMSGGGRCNFTNYSVDAANYISSNPHFCISALNRYSQWQFLAMVEAHGIEYEERSHGQLFCKGSAKAILAMLLDECEHAGVEIRTDCDVSNIEVLAAAKQQESGTCRYKLDLSRGQQLSQLQSSALIVATGALSIPTLGGSAAGYDIAQQFGLPLIDRRAGLVPFMFSDALKPVCERLSGLALQVDVSCNGQQFSENMLFTHRGISGPVILQISNYWYPGDEITLNLLPDIDAADWLLNEKNQQGKTWLKTLLAQRLAKSLVKELQALWRLDVMDSALAECTDKQLMAIGKQLNQWCLKPSATEGYRTAEVTLGGVDTDAISSKTMEAKQQPGLYFIGEVVDVTGHLGGFNFQWAWSSGYSAGSFA
ncbi:MAG: NAD(P)/FAD-dependent oxidoreductase [Oceanicoccus sp.]